MVNNTALKSNDHNNETNLFNQTIQSSCYFKAKDAHHFVRLKILYTDYKFKYFIFSISCRMAHSIGIKKLKV
jgi:hypothetical protein